MTAQTTAIDEPITATLDRMLKKELRNHGIVQKDPTPIKAPKTSRFSKPAKETSDKAAKVAAPKPPKQERPPREKRRGLLSRILGRQDGTSAAATASRRSDLTIAALGVTLGLICALFPWYIFFNQDQFGVKAMKFEGNSQPQSDSMVLTDQPQRVGAPMQVENPPEMELDLFATGTLPDPLDELRRNPPGIDQQPFPVEEPEFSLVHVANGRAMIADDGGLFVVQRGERLPDNSTVKSIEQRNGAWVLVTSKDRVIPIQ